MRKLLILPAILLLAYPCPAQKILPSVSVSTTAVAQSNGPVEVQGDLISTFPPGKTKAEAGRLFVFVLNGDLPYTITPKVPTLDSVNAEGKRVVMLAAPETDFTLSISFQVVHPTPEEALEAIKDKATYAKYIREHSRDEVFQDSHTVQVGEDKQDDDKGDDEKEDDKQKPEGPYWFIIVEETGERSGETAKIFQAADFWNSLKSEGHKVRWYDDDQAAAKPFANLTTHRPALIITTLSGEVVTTEPLPKTTDAIRELIQ